MDRIVTTPNRPEPRLPITAVQSFGIHMPKATHWRKATCAEVECKWYLEGWVTVVPAGSDQALIVRHSGRRFREIPQEGGMTAFVFEAGQRCFRADDHHMKLDRPEIYVVRDGDWRGNPTGRRRIHARPLDWVDEFSDHLGKVNEQIEKG